MADNIDVLPATKSRKQSVATTEVSGVHYPNYVMYGVNSSGDLVPINADAHGHIETAIHSPSLPFGSLHTESLNPIFQNDAVYGIDVYHNEITTSLSGTVTGSGNLFKCSTGTTSLAQAVLQSKQRLRYRAGQGVVGRFTALWSDSALTTSLNISVAGFGTAESGFYFGYYEVAASTPEFGILHTNGAKREIQTLTVSTASTTTDDIQITLNGTEFTVSGITASSDTVMTAYEISNGTFTGWTAEASGSDVIFLASAAGDKTSSFSIAQAGAGTPAAGSYVETLAGYNTNTDTFIPQSTWNGDKLDGTGPSGSVLDTTKGNVFQIGIQYLGFGSITFDVEVAAPGNNPVWVTVHTIDAPNSLTSVTSTQPSFPFTMAAYSATSTTDVSISTGSYAGFIEGEKKLNGPRLSYTGGIATTATVTAIGTVRNNLVFNGRPNQSIINVIDINFTSRSSNNTYTILYLYRNAALGGTPDFAEYTELSPGYIDTSATTATISDQNQLVWSGTIMEQGTIDHTFPDNIDLQPGETLTFAVATSSGTGFSSVSLNTREDH